MLDDQTRSDYVGTCMKIVNITEAKATLSRLIANVISGEEILITRMGKPVVKLSQYHPAQKHRRIGGLKNKIKIPKDFDSWPDEEASALGIID